MQIINKIISLLAIFGQVLSQSHVKKYTYFLFGCLWCRLSQREQVRLGKIWMKVSIAIPPPFSKGSAGGPTTDPLSEWRKGSKAGTFLKKRVLNGSFLPVMLSFSFSISRVREFLPFLFANRFLRRGKVFVDVDELRRFFVWPCTVEYVI